MDLKNILCPTDLSEASAHAIDQAIVIAGWYQARITALHVVNPMFMAVPRFAVPNDELVDELERQRLRRETSACFDRASESGTAVDTVVDLGQPAARILDRAAILPADLIVMGTHGAGGFEHLILGS